MSILCLLLLSATTTKPTTLSDQLFCALAGKINVPNSSYILFYKYFEYCLSRLSTFLFKLLLMNKVAARYKYILKNI